MAGPGRRAGRVEVGGRNRAHPVGVVARRGEDLADELVPAHRTLVRHVMDARPAVDGESVKRWRQVGGERGLAALVVDEREGLIGIRRETQHQLDHVVAVLPAHPRRSSDRRTRPRRQLAGELRAAVHRLRVGDVVLAIRAVERAVEHIVGADVHEVRAHEFAGRRQVPDRIAVHRKGHGLVGLTGVDGGVGSSVDHRIRTDFVEQPANGVGIGDVEVGLGDGDDLVVERAGVVDDVDAELPGGAGDEQPHGYGSTGGGGPMPRK